MEDPFKKVRISSNAPITWIAPLLTDTTLYLDIATGIYITGRSFQSFLGELDKFANLQHQFMHFRDKPGL